MLTHRRSVKYEFPRRKQTIPDKSVGDRLFLFKKRLADALPNGELLPPAQSYSEKNSYMIRLKSLASSYAA